jgi:hypothetical protein
MTTSRGNTSMQARSTQRNSRLWLLIGSAIFMLALAISVSIALETDRAEAKFFYKGSNAFVAGQTLDPSDGHPVDPITVIFTGGGAQHYDTQYGGNIYNAIQASIPLNNGVPMNIFPCNPDQALWYKAYTPGGNAIRFAWRHDQFETDTPDNTDLNMSNSPQCLTQNHIRIWDDYDYSRWSGVGRNAWAVGTMHHEHRDSDGHHVKDRAFEQQAWYLGAEMHKHLGWCMDYKWKMLAGSMHKAGASGLEYSDGYLTKISDPRDGACAPG